MPNTHPEPSIPNYAKKEKSRNYSTRLTQQKNATDAKHATDYPSFTRRRSASPLTTRASTVMREESWVLKRLGLIEADVKDLPEVTPKVKEAFGGVEGAIEVLRGDDSPDSLKIVAKWNSLSSKDQKVVRMEWLCRSIGLTGRRLMELLAGATFDHHAMMSKMFVYRSQLKVLEATVRAATDSQPIFNKDGEVIAQSNGDVRAQEIFHKITGALPTPKASSFILNQQINQPQSQPTGDEPRTPLQAMDAFLLEIDDVRKPKQLEARNQPIIPVEMPIGAPEIEYLSIEE